MAWVSVPWGQRGAGRWPSGPWCVSFMPYLLPWAQGLGVPGALWFWAASLLDLTLEPQHPTATSQDRPQV